MMNQERAVEPVKRFIAGAVCPRCAQMDRILMYTVDGVQHRECVNCGFSDQMRFVNSPRELETRVNRTAEERADAVRPVRLFDPDKSDDQ